MVDRLIAHGLLPERWDGAAWNRVAELAFGGGIFVVAWLMTMWGWGLWVGILVGWAPALGLAWLAAPLWRPLVGMGAVAVVSVFLVRIL